MALASTLALVVLAAVGVEGGEIISDLVAPQADARLARNIKAESFWTPMLKAAEEVNLTAHLQLYADTEAAIAELPEGAGYVRDALTESLQRLQSADKLVLAQAAGSWQVARDGLKSPQAEEFFSFLKGGQNFLRDALQRFVDGGDYNDRLRADIDKRQGELLPALRGAANVAGDVLTDARLASKRAFDVMKYNIYISRTPKTPKAADAVANRLVEASGETRRHFMGMITAAVKGITQDMEGQSDKAAATVTQSSMGVSPAVMMGVSPQSMLSGQGAVAAAPIMIYDSSDAEVGLQLV
jgi:hypothetical protein